jgi:protein SCO1/2
MMSWLWILSTLSFALLIPTVAKSSLPSDPAVRVFRVRGVVVGLRPENQIVVIRHTAISNYMDAMTMPFKVRTVSELNGLRPGSEVNFDLHVGADESWVANLVPTGIVSPLPAEVKPAVASNPHPPRELLHYAFTNELGQPVTLSDFPGQALAITFFYTRCPLPDYCPRLSKNFAGAQQDLLSRTNAPANWHFISISFDPEFDSPEILRAYGQLYQYDPAHWSFLTGPVDKIRELARACGVTMQNIDGTINHNFRTLIIDASGHLQMVFPTSGDLSGQIASEIIKGAAVSNVALTQTNAR